MRAKHPAQIRGGDRPEPFKIGAAVVQISTTTSARPRRDAWPDMVLRVLISPTTAWRTALAITREEKPVLAQRASSRSIAAYAVLASQRRR